MARSACEPTQAIVRTDTAGLSETPHTRSWRAKDLHIPKHDCSSHRLVGRHSHHGWQVRLSHGLAPQGEGNNYLGNVALHSLIEEAFQAAVLQRPLPNEFAASFKDWDHISGSSTRNTFPMLDKPRDQNLLPRSSEPHRPQEPSLEIYL